MELCQKVLDPLSAGVGREQECSSPESAAVSLGEMLSQRDGGCMVYQLSPTPKGMLCKHGCLKGDMSHCACMACFPASVSSDVGAFHAECFLKGIGSAVMAHHEKVRWFPWENSALRSAQAGREHLNTWSSLTSMRLVIFSSQNATEFANNFSEHTFTRYLQITTFLPVFPQEPYCSAFCSSGL